MSDDTATEPAANPWLVAMGIPEWRRRRSALLPANSAAAAQASIHTQPASPRLAAAASDGPAESLAAAPVGASRGPEPAAALESHAAKVANLPDKPVAPANASRAAPLRDAPLLVIWDAELEQTVAGAGSLPAGPLGDLLANIIAAVGLTEDVVLAWSAAPSEAIADRLQQLKLRPRCIWQFGVAERPEQRSLLLAAAEPVNHIVSPALRGLQQHKAHKAELWALLKPLKAAGLWSNG